MKEGYYYLVSSLPELSISDRNPSTDLGAFRDFVKPLLLGCDRDLLAIIFHSYDLENLVSLIKGLPIFHPFGNYDRSELQQIIEQPSGYPAFFGAFLYEIHGKWDLISGKRMLNLGTGYFVDWCQSVSNDFLKKWLIFDQNLKNLLIWLNSYKFGLSPGEEILGTFYEAEYLRQSKPENIDLKSWDFRFKEALQHYDNPDIGVRELIINEMRWNYLDEISQPYASGIEPILSYAIRLLLIKRNLIDTEDDGRRQLQEIMKSLLDTYSIPEKYTVV